MMGINPQGLAEKPHFVLEQAAAAPSAAAAGHHVSELLGGELRGLDVESLRSEHARIQSENEQLRRDNEQLRQKSDWLEREEQQLRWEDTELRRQDSERARALNEQEAALRKRDEELRMENAELRAQDAQFRLALSSSMQAHKEASVSSRGHGQAHVLGHKENRLIVWACAAGLGAMVSILAIMSLCECWWPSDDDDSDEEADNEDNYEGNRLRLNVRGGNRKVEEDQRAEEKLKMLVKRKRSCCWCCYTKGVAIFTLVFVVVTTLSGGILWELGILQPAFAQLAMYAYIIFALALFVSLLVWELWRVMQRVVLYIIVEFRKIKDVFKWRPGGVKR